MLDFSRTSALVLEEIDALSERLGSLSEADWERPTRCEGWDVRALVLHTIAAMWQQAEAFHRVRIGATEAPSYLEAAPDLDPGAGLDRARAHLVQGLAVVTPGEDPTVPLPFMALPASFAIQILLIEYGFHRNDLLWALGDERPVRPEAAAVQIELLPAYLPGAATRLADEGSGFRLEAPSGTTSLVCRDGSWTLGDPLPEQRCTVAGDDSAVALFTLGRISADHDSLRVDDPPGIAKRFKDFFPGP